MATYVSKIWEDRQSEYPTRRTLTWIDPETQQTKTLDVLVTRNEGTVTTEGDPFAALVMNALESRINAGFGTCNDTLVSANSPTAADGKNNDIFVKTGEDENQNTVVVGMYVKVSGSWLEIQTGGASLPQAEGGGF